MITLKRATKEDCLLVFGWRNHPDVRKHFFKDRELTYAEHQAWFEDSLERDDRVILVAHEKDDAVGVIRFDFLKAEPTTAEVDIYVCPDRHGKGLGTRILAEGDAWIRQNHGVQSLVARVKEDNPASIKMFKRCGFETDYVFLRKEEKVK